MWRSTLELGGILPKKWSFKVEVDRLQFIQKFLMIRWLDCTLIRHPGKLTVNCYSWWFRETEFPESDMANIWVYVWFFEMLVQGGLVENLSTYWVLCTQSMTSYVTQHISQHTLHYIKFHFLTKSRRIPSLLLHLQHPFLKSSIKFPSSSSRLPVTTHLGAQWCILPYNGSSNIFRLV